MKMILVALALILSMASCEKSSQEENPPTNSNPQDTLSFSYLALGDSYTIGTGLTDASGRYPVQLATRLDEEPLLESDTVVIIAQNGWTTGNLLNALNSASIDRTFDLVSLLIGVNNQFQGRTIEEYTLHFEQLLDSAISFAGGDTSRVFVLSIPDYGVTPFGQGLNPEEIEEEIDNFNNVNAGITSSYGITYFDITGISRMADTNPSLLAPDSLHPSGLMYGLWVDEMIKTVKLKLHE